MSLWHTSEIDDPDNLIKLDIKELLTLILLELKRMNQHLYSMTDEEGE